MVDIPLVKKVLKPFGFKDPSQENVVDSDEYKEKYDQMELAQKVFDEWDESESTYSQVFIRLTEDRDFYLGATNQQWSSSPEGSLQLIFNVGATIIDLFTYIVSNNTPNVQFIPEGVDSISQVKADFGETLTRKLLENAKFKKRFKDGVKQLFSLGFFIPYSFWNPDNKLGGEKGTWEISNLNPFTTRLRFAGDDYEQLLSFITVKRMLPSVVKEKYGFDALPDMELKMLPKTITLTDDGMVNVFRRYNDKTIITVVNGRAIKEEKHNLGFVPARLMNNNIVTNDAFGYSEFYRWKPVAQELNALITAASEISRDLAYPPLLEINNSLGGRKVSKWRGQKIPVRVSDKGEGLRFMLNTAQIAPLLKQIQLLLDLFHFITLMPKAAAGIFEPSVTSGFQAKLAMQPATLTTENRKIDLEYLIKDMVRDAIRYLEKYDPDALTIKLDDGEDFKFEDLEKHEMQIVWPENLPVDIAREVQNLILGLQNNLTSVQQAVDKYNVMMGMGSPTDTVSYLKDEAEKPEISPDRALKVATAREKVQQLSGMLGGINNQLTQLRGSLNNGQNPTNMARGATSPLPEEQRVSSQGPESVAPTSTGGVPVPVGPQGGGQ